MVRQGEALLRSLFQSTPPARGATKINNGVGAGLVISIHAPREGGDTISMAGAYMYNLFQSTPPARGATSRALLGDS